MTQTQTTQKPNYYLLQPTTPEHKAQRELLESRLEELNVYKPWRKEFLANLAYIQSYSTKQAEVYSRTAGSPDFSQKAVVKADPKYDNWDDSWAVK